MKATKFLSVILAVLMLVGMMSFGVSAAGFTSDTSWYDADPTATEFTISTADELYGLSMLVYGGNKFAGKTIKLDADIDLENKEWFPIGTSSKPFNGTFDGCGHKISNLKLTRPNNGNIGFFGRTNDGAIKNFTIENADVKGSGAVGAVAGCPYTSYYENILVTGDVFVTGTYYVGGALGYNCYNSVTNVDVIANEGSYVRCDSDVYATYVGGVIGFMGEGNFTIEDCDAEIDVIGSTYGVGGILGMLHYNETLKNSTFKGNIEMDGSYAETDSIGALVGIVYGANSSTAILNCSATVESAVILGEDVTDTIYPFGAFWHAAFTENSIFHGADVTINGEYGRFPMGVMAGEYLYGGLTPAAAAAEADSTVLFCSDNTYAATVATDNNITIDMNGKTLTADLTFANNSEITLKNGTIDGNIIVDGAGENFKLTIEDIKLTGNISAGEADIAIKSGYFNTGVGAYCADGVGLIPSNDPDYVYMVGTPENKPEVNTAVSAGESKVEGNVTDVIVDKNVTAEKVTATVTDSKVVDAISGAATLVSNNEKVVGTHDEAVTELEKEIEVAPEAEVTVVIQPYMNIEVVDATVNDEAPENNSISYAIEARYNVVATTANVANGEAIITDTENDDQNAVVIKENQKLDMVGKPIEIALPLPTGFANEGDTVYIIHTKNNGQQFIYTAIVKDGKAVFTNPNGFSTFTAVAVNPGIVATIGGTNYFSLQDAVDAATEGKTIEILSADDLSAVIGENKKKVSFKNAAGEAITVKLVAEDTVNSKFIGWTDGETSTDNYIELDTDETAKVPTPRYKSTVKFMFLLPARLNFNTNGGTEIDSVNTFLSIIANLDNYTTTREGYKFGGWFADEALTEAVDRIKIDVNTTVYAGWIKDGEEAVEKPETPEVTEDEKSEETTETPEVTEDEKSEEAPEADEAPDTKENTDTSENA